MRLNAPMQTQADIVKFIEANSGFLDFTGEVLKPYLDFEHARPYLRPGTTAEEWETVAAKDISDDAVKTALADYIAFAWGKVEDHRGISASRSVDKCSAWAWLLAGDDIIRDIEAAGYAQYGAPKLAVICKRFGLPIPDGEWARRMIAGEPCGAGDCGCG